MIRFLTGASQHDKCQSVLVWKRIILHHGRNTIHPGRDVLTNPLSNVPSGEKTKHFQHVHSAPSQEEENVQLLHASKMWSLCSVPHYEIAVGDITVCKTACLLCNIPVISHRGETSLPMYNNKYASQSLRRCLFRLVVVLLLRPSHLICKHTHTLQQKTYQRCACV